MNSSELDCFLICNYGTENEGFYLCSETKNNEKFMVIKSWAHEEFIGSGSDFIVTDSSDIQDWVKIPLIKNSFPLIENDFSSFNLSSVGVFFEGGILKKRNDSPVNEIYSDFNLTKPINTYIDDGEYKKAPFLGKVIFFNAVINGKESLISVTDKNLFGKVLNIPQVKENNVTGEIIGLTSGMQYQTTFTCDKKEYLDLDENSWKDVTGEEHFFGNKKVFVRYKNSDEYVYVFFENGIVSPYPEIYQIDDIRNTISFKEIPGKEIYYNVISSSHFPTNDVPNKFIGNEFFAGDTLVEFFAKSYPENKDETYQKVKVNFYKSEKPIMNFEEKTRTLSCINSNGRMVIYGTESSGNYSKTFTENLKIEDNFEGTLGFKFWDSEATLIKIEKKKRWVFNNIKILRGKKYILKLKGMGINSEKSVNFKTIEILKDPLPKENFTFDIYNDSSGLINIDIYMDKPNHGYIEFGVFDSATGEALKTIDSNLEALKNETLKIKIEKGKLIPGKEYGLELKGRCSDYNSGEFITLKEFYYGEKETPPTSVKMIYNNHISENTALLIVEGHGEYIIKYRDGSSKVLGEISSNSPIETEVNDSEIDDENFYVEVIKKGEKEYLNSIPTKVFYSVRNTATINTSNKFFYDTLYVENNIQDSNKKNVTRIFYKKDKMFSTNNFVEIKITEKNSFDALIESGTIEEFLMWTYFKFESYVVDKISGERGVSKFSGELAGYFQPAFSNFLKNINQNPAFLFNNNIKDDFSTEIANNFVFSDYEALYINIESTYKKSKYSEIISEDEIVTLEIPTNKLYSIKKNIVMGERNHIIIENAELMDFFDSDYHAETQFFITKTGTSLALGSETMSINKPFKDFACGIFFTDGGATRAATFSCIVPSDGVWQNGGISIFNHMNYGLKDEDGNYTYFNTLNSIESFIDFCKLERAVGLNWSSEPVMDVSEKNIPSSCYRFPYYTGSGATDYSGRYIFDIPLDKLGYSMKYRNKNMVDGEFDGLMFQGTIASGRQTRTEAVAYAPEPILREIPKFAFSDGIIGMILGNVGTFTTGALLERGAIITPDIIINGKSYIYIDLATFPRVEGQMVDDLLKQISGQSDPTRFLSIPNIEKRNIACTAVIMGHRNNGTIVQGKDLCYVPKSNIAIIYQNGIDMKEHLKQVVIDNL